MNEHSNILKETQAISPLVAGIGNQTPYRTPDGFFDAFPMEMIHQLKTEGLGSNEHKNELSNLSPLLASVEPVTPYTAPEGYFPSLHQSTLEGVKAVDFVQETLNNPSVLAQPESRQTPYAVPEGYFETLPGILQSRLPAQPVPAPVVRMHWMRYAVAVALLGVVAVGGWLGWLAIQSPDPSTEWVQVQQQIQSVNDEELAAFIQQQNPLIQTDLALSDETLTDSDIQSILSEYADEELLEFMEGTAEANRIIEN